MPIGGGRMAGDVTTFAGREAQLMFSTTSYNGPWLYFDDVTFSPVAVPEPSLLWLVGLSFIVLYFCRRLPVKTKSDRLAMKPARAGCTLLCILGFPLAASAATIDFESLPGMDNAMVPVPAASQLSDQFLSTLGVSFSSGSPYVAVVNLGQFFAASGINSIGGSTPGGLLTYDAAFPIVAMFFDPNHPATPATTDFVSLRIDLLPTSGQNVTLNAFDLNGHLITSFVTPDDSGATLHVSAAGIHSVQFIGTMDSTGAAVDDFTFNPVVAVPEPSTISLLLVGGAALWYAVHRPAKRAALLYKGMQRTREQKIRRVWLREDRDIRRHHGLFLQHPC